ncbi:MAG: YjjG family noncanonical pyrimidine nucleotidase [Anaerolineales bacterium]|jgi:2-haloacid dehalogenase
MSYLWLLFDADDTLFDYPLAEAKALRSTFEHFGQVYRSQYLQIYQIFNRLVWEEFERGETSAAELRLNRFRLLFDEIGIPLYPQDFSQNYLENLAHASDLFPGVADVLKTLSGHYHTAMVTNGLKDVQRPRLQHSAISSFIEKVFISEEMGVAKPAGGFFEAVFREIGFPPKAEVLIIGDSLTSDIQGGISYGIDTCWFNPTGKTTTLPVTYMIKTLGQLLKILK